MTFKAALDVAYGHSRHTKRRACMFSFFRKKKAPVSIPEFPDAAIAVERETRTWCLSQIGDYLGGEPQPLPDLGLHHDVMVGSYVCGFMQGQFIVSGHLKQWAKGDEGMEMLGFMALAGPCLHSVLGNVDRSLLAMEYLPQIGPAKWTLGIQQIDTMGGTDGMAHAKGEPKQKNGLLRFYLEKNVE